MGKPILLAICDAFRTDNESDALPNIRGAGTHYVHTEVYEAPDTKVEISYDAVVSSIHTPLRHIANRWWFVDANRLHRSGESCASGCVVAVQPSQQLPPLV
jgi:hypothetical protein